LSANSHFTQVVYFNTDDDIGFHGIQNPDLPGPIIALFMTTIIGIVGVAAYKYYHDKELRGPYRIEGMGRYQSSPDRRVPWEAVSAERLGAGSSIGSR
jgi:hypothetical protein